MNGSMKTSLALLTCSFLAMATAVIRASAATWVSPSFGQPSGNIAAPLNTSLTDQTKAGGLSVNNLTIVDPQTLTIGRTDTTTRFCWNDNGDGTNCRSDWSEISVLSGFVHLQPPQETDTGRFTLHQAGLGSDTQQGTLTVIAGEPKNTIPTYGVWGEASDNAGGVSSGINATANLNGHYAVAGSNGGFADAWAGYFIGNVTISKYQILGTEYFPDLAVGAGSAPDSDATSEICLGGTCLDTWPTVIGTGLWSRNAGVGVLRPNDDTKSLSVANNKFAVNITAGAAPQADLTLGGRGKFDQFVIGSPPAGSPVVITCSDGACNGNECDPDTFPKVAACRNDAALWCKSDCDIIPPPNAQLNEVFADPFLCEFGPCFPPPATLHIHYTLPQWPDGSAVDDLAGVRVIIREDRFPTGPNDAGYMPSIFAPSKADVPVPNNRYDLSNCDQSAQYLVGLYAYDTTGHFAAGTVGYGLCTDGEVTE